MNAAASAAIVEIGNGGPVEKVAVSHWGRLQMRCCVGGGALLLN